MQGIPKPQSPEKFQRPFALSLLKPLYRLSANGSNISTPDPWALIAKQLIFLLIRPVEV